MADSLILSNALEELKKEIQMLRGRLAVLYQEREELLSHVCPRLQAEYARLIGVYENQAHALELQILELKRRIEIVQAAINREKAIAQERVDEQIREEYEAFHQKVEEEKRNAQKAQEEQQEREERRRTYEKQWNEKHSDSTGDSGEDTGSAEGHSDENSETGDGENGQECGEEHRKGKEEKAPNIKELYRKIVKCLHPDVNPTATEHEKELFRKATKAYQDGDLETLQEIYEEVFGGGAEKEEEDNLQDPEKLKEIRDALLEKIGHTESEISEIKQKAPYKYKDLLSDPEKIQLVQNKIQEAIGLYQKEIERLQKKLEEVCQQMENLRNGGETDL